MAIDDPMSALAMALDTALCERIGGLAAALEGVGVERADIGRALIAEGAAAFLADRGPAETAKLLRDAADHLERRQQ